ncbi:MAG: tRNA pseudouridine65 synthase [Planctomycetota bacterium]|jgi:tRNA pseudouridine65 synthase
MLVANEVVLSRPNRFDACWPMTETPDDPVAPDEPVAPDAPVEPAPGPLPVLLQDEDFIAVSKPSGLLVHRDKHYPEAHAALQIVRDQVGQYVYPFHRLDRATSGILMFGLSSESAAALQKCLSAPDAHKDYLALMRYPGSNKELGASWTMDRPLTDDKDIARECRSDFQVIETFSRCALVQCRIFTGRYHQIRRHANHAGRHVIGDTTHGKGRINATFRKLYGLERLFLHLRRVEMAHPTSGERFVLEDPMPEELTQVLGRLRAVADS